MTQKDELLAAYDAVWSADWESLWSVLPKVTEEEAHFQHPIYSDVEREEGHPPSGTIMWHLVHLSHCYRWYKLVIEQRPNTPEDPGPPPGATLAEAIESLKKYRDELRETIANVPEEALEEKLYYDKPVVALCRSTVRHDAWHASQIAVARRLYKHR
jgi:hypothetical protein